MQNLERYFGFRVSINERLDEVSLEAIKDRATKILLARDFNPEEYFLYFHQLSVFRPRCSDLASKPKCSHFGMPGGLSARLEKIHLSYAVNQKQRKSGHIKIYNYLLDDHRHDQVRLVSDHFDMQYEIDGQYLADKQGFRSEIVTFVKKTVKQAHRKLKVSVTAFPTAAYSCQHFDERQGSNLTQLDLTFRKHIELCRSNVAGNQLALQREGVKTMADGNQTHIHIEGQIGQLIAQAGTVMNRDVVGVQNSGGEYEKLRDELERILVEMGRDGVDGNHHGDTAASVEHAIEAAKKSDRESLLGHLKKVKDKIYAISEKISIPLVVEFLKRGVGM